MSNHEQTPDSNMSNSVSEQIPHSGVHHDEKPINNFDNTTLDEAHQQGLLQTPESPAALAPAPQQEKKLGWKKPAAAIALIGAVAAGAFGIGKMGGGDNNTAPRQETSTSASSNPGESNTAETQTDGALDFTFNAEAYADNPKQILTDFFTKFNEWQNTGYTKAATSADRRYELGDDEAYAHELNQASNEQWVQDVFVSDWQSNSNLVNWLNTDEKVHDANISIALKTGDGSNRADLEPYKRYTDLDMDSVVVQSASANKIVVSGLTNGRDNRDKNNAGRISVGVDPNGEHGGETITFVKVGDTFKVSNIEAYSGQ